MKNQVLLTKAVKVAQRRTIQFFANIHSLKDPTEVIEWFQDFTYPGKPWTPYKESGYFWMPNFTLNVFGNPDIKIVVAVKLKKDNLDEDSYTPVSLTAYTPKLGYPVFEVNFVGEEFVELYSGRVARYLENVQVILTAATE